MGAVPVGLRVHSVVLAQLRERRLAGGKVEPADARVRYRGDSGLPPETVAGSAAN